MRTLVIETSGTACSVALIEDRLIIAERHERVGRGHAERLIPWIAALPNGGRADRIWVGCGPGSFTGVRIGIAAARALGLGWGVPVAGFSSLALIAAACDETGLTVAVEGGHGEIFVQDFDKLPHWACGLLSSATPEAAARAGAKPLVIGSGATKLVDARHSGEARDADARATAALFFPDDFPMLAPSPLYGRAADARPLAILAS